MRALNLRCATSGEVGVILRRWLDLSESAKELVMGMLEYDPKTRLTAKQVSKADPLRARTDLPICAKGRCT